TKFQEMGSKLVFGIWFLKFALKDNIHDRLRLPTTGSYQEVRLFRHHPGSVPGDFGPANLSRPWLRCPGRKAVHSGPGSGRRRLDRAGGSPELGGFSGDYHYLPMGGRSGQTKKTPVERAGVDCPIVDQASTPLHRSLALSKLEPVL